MKPGLMGATLMAWSLCAWGQVEIEQERTRIDDVRRHQSALFAEQERACQSKFAVTGCQSEVDARRRAVMNGLKRQEAALNDKQRAHRGVEQMRRSDEKARENAARNPAEAASSSPESSVRAEREKEHLEKVKNHPAPGPVAPTRVPGATATTVINETQRSKGRDAYQAKLKEAEKKRAERDKRLQERGSAPLALPLPP